jgi:hypothetical protein
LEKKTTSEIYAQVTAVRTTTNLLMPDGRTTVLTSPVTLQPLDPMIIDTRTLTTYSQYVRIFIHDGKANAEQKFPRRYEGLAQWEGFSNDLTKIVPSGLKALLMDFPGTSGSSQVVSLSGSDLKP